MIEIELQENDQIQSIDKYSNLYHHKLFSIQNNQWLLLIRKHISSPIHSELKLNDKFKCSFIRHVNLIYAAKVNSLFEVLQQQTNNIQEQWLMLYHVHQYKPKKCKKYPIKCPQYGIHILIRSNSQMTRGSICNLFKYHGQVFYMISSLIENHPDLSTIFCTEQKELLGLLIKCSKHYLCLPFCNIISQRSCQIKIPLQIRNNLQKTCHLCYEHNYSTGIIINKFKLITTKHLLPFHAQKLNTTIIIRTYQFKSIIQGYVTKIGLQNLDFMEITSKLQLTINDTNLLLDQEQSRNKILKIGTEISAIGFGKFSYKQQNFNQIDVILPTIQYGYITKIITIGQSIINIYKQEPLSINFIKTDSKLFNGCSGCGLWNNTILLGMAVFILYKEVQNNKFQFNHHNYSYSIESIHKIMSLNSKQQILLSFNKQIEKFDKIKIRNKIKTIQNQQIKSKL